MVEKGVIYLSDDSDDWPYEDTKSYTSSIPKIIEFNFQRTGNIFGFKFVLSTDVEIEICEIDMFGKEILKYHILYLDEK
jgi:hypothetical protein